MALRLFAAGIGVVALTGASFVAMKYVYRKLFAKSEYSNIQYSNRIVVVLGYHDNGNPSLNSKFEDLKNKLSNLSKPIVNVCETKDLRI